MSAGGPQIGATSLDAPANRHSGVNRPGSIVAVSRSATHNFSKAPQPSIVLLAGEGVEGDAHRGRTIQHLYLQRRSPAMPNHSQVHLFAAEMLAELEGRGFALHPGELGENVLTTGLDLLSLPEGTRLHLGACAVVQLTGLRTPCAKLDGLRAGLQQHLWGPLGTDGKRTRRAGVMSTVEHSGEVRSGDRITVELPTGAHRPLRPV